MSRAATGDVVALRPEANVYTVLVIAAVIAQILGIVVIYIRAREVGVSFW
jgi:hypothetical protein